MVYNGGGDRIGDSNPSHCYITVTSFVSLLLLRSFASPDNILSQLEKSIVPSLHEVHVLVPALSDPDMSKDYAELPPTTPKRPSSLGKALRTSSALNFQPMSSKPV